MRSAVDFYRVAFRGRWRFYVSCLAMAGSVVSYASAAVALSTGLVVGTATLVLSMVLLIPEWLDARRPKTILATIDRPMRGFSSPPGAQLVSLPSQAGNVAVSWPEIDRLLPESFATCSWSGRTWTLPDRLARYKLDILACKRTKSTFNGPILRQDSELTAELLAQGGDVQFSGARYFDLMCSNYVSTYELIDHRTGARELYGPDLIRSGIGSLATLDESDLANGVGVSTLAFTSDGCAVLTLQTQQAQSSAGHWAPSGSGSMDLRDVPDRDGDRRQLRVVVARAMERELVEERNLDFGDVDQTQVLGYFRWLSKGAKPEYVGVTRLKVPADRVVAKAVRVVERDYVASKKVISFSLGRLRQHPERTPRMGHGAGQLSMPLHMCLRALGYALRRDDPVGRWLARVHPDGARSESR